jgi:LacI family transcriptional regulator
MAGLTSQNVSGSLRGYPETFWLFSKLLCSVWPSMSSLKTLALSLNLSITTVSRALDDKSDVSPITKLKVRDAARRLNYQPNAAARSLRKRKADAVAVVLPAGASQIGLGALLTMLFDASNALAADGLDLMMFTPPGGETELKTLQRIVEGRRADALILVRTDRQDARVDFLTSRGIPFVTHGRTECATAHAFIDGDGFAGFREATNSLVALGHRRIAHLGAPHNFTFAEHRRQGWIAGMHDAGLSVAGLSTVSAPNETGAFAAAQAILKQSQHPTGLLCASDAMAIGAMTAVKQAGLIPGRDLSIIGHDGLPSGHFTDPPLSTMEIDAENVGAKLAAALVRRLAGDDPRDLQTILPVRQVPRGTHGPALTEPIQAVSLPRPWYANQPPQ